MKKIKYTHVVFRDCGYRVMIVLYDDGTWEELFKYFRTKWSIIDGKLFLRKTREEAIELYNQLVNKEGEESVEEA